MRLSPAHRRTRTADPSAPDIRDARFARSGVVDHSSPLRQCLIQARQHCRILDFSCKPFVIHARGTRRKCQFCLFTLADRGKAL
jgi:hypothetical protein